jgi:hypothetical protein
MTKQWDVFISHASEDKEAVALPLAHVLRSAGVRVWLDRFEIQLGESIRAKIDEGLAHSRFGVVILSEAFFRKLWTSRELDGLFARDVVLPVWHGVDEPAVIQYSPMIAAKKASSTSEGLDQVAHAILSRIYRVGDVHERSIGPGLARRFATLLAQQPPRDELVAFLSAHPRILTHALGLDRESYLRAAVELGGTTVDFSAARYQPSSGRYDDWQFLLLGLPSDSLFDEVGEPTPGLRSGVTHADTLRKWVLAHVREASAILPRLRPIFRTTIIAGRRPQPDSILAGRLAEFNDQMVGSQVRTYDWLLDAAFAVDDDHGGVR